MVLCFGGPHGNGHCERVSDQILIQHLDVRPRLISSAVLPNNLAMDGARDTVLQLEVHLGNSVFREYGCIRDITCSTLYQRIVRQAGYNPSPM